jgi:hypothetical protein
MITITAKPIRPMSATASISEEDMIDFSKNLKENSSGKLQFNDERRGVCFRAQTATPQTTRLMEGYSRLLTSFTNHEIDKRRNDQQER